MEVGMLDTIGLPWQLKDRYVEKILAVTAEQVQQVANKYLVDERLTVAALDPLPIENGGDSEPAASTGVAHGR
jgi:zinc protease